MDRSVLARKPMTELKDIAAHLNMRGYQKLRKAELIDAIVESATCQAAAADAARNGGAQGSGAAGSGAAGNGGAAGSGNGASEDDPQSKTKHQQPALPHWHTTQQRQQLQNLSPTERIPLRLSMLLMGRG